MLSLLISWIKDFLSDRSFMVRVNSSIWAPRPLPLSMVFHPGSKNNGHDMAFGYFSNYES